MIAFDAFRLLTENVEGFCMTPVAEFLAHLRQHELSKPICFCRCPQGLQLSRFKRRGEDLIQLEFAEGIFRTKQGQLWLDDQIEGDIPTASELRPHAQTVGVMLSRWKQAQDLQLFFGGTEDALQFVGVEDIGEWVSIEFEQQVFRGADGRFVIEETRDGRVVRDIFPLFKEREFAASLKEYKSTRIDGLS